MSADRYASVNALHEIAEYPPVTRGEAERAYRALVIAFGSREHASAARGVAMSRGNYGPRCRNCWISAKPTRGHFKGWGRLIHDTAHRIWRYRHPGLRPHDHGEEAIELAVAQFVYESGWLLGSLKPKPRAKADTLARIDASIERWDAKARRAANALKRLKRQRAALVRYRIKATQAQPSGEVL